MEIQSILIICTQELGQSKVNETNEAPKELTANANSIFRLYTHEVGKQHSPTVA